MREPVLTDRGLDALESYLHGGPILPEACEPEERSEIFDAHRWFGRAVNLKVLLDLKAERDMPRLARWRANMARHIVLRGETFRTEHEARALARLVDRARPAGAGFTMLTIGAVEVRWNDDTAAWSIMLPPSRTRSHPETVRGTGIVSLWMLARDRDGIDAEADITEACNL